jgi:predicted nucleic acid-binding protein
LSVTLVNVTQGVQYPDSIYADANLFCYARNRLSGYYQITRTILADLIIQNTRLHISQLVVDEMWWALLRVWYRNTTGIDLYPRMVKNDVSILRRYSDLVRRSINKVLRLPNVVVLPLQQDSADIIRCALNIYSSDDLMPRDCFHLAYVVTHGIEGFVTSDPNFDSLNLPNYDLTIYKF